MIEAAALLLVAGGIACGVLGVAVTRSLRHGVAMMLDLWVAAGLLRLDADLTWQRIAAAAALIVVRKLIVAAIDSR